MVYTAFVAALLLLPFAVLLLLLLPWHSPCQTLDGDTLKVIELSEMLSSLPLFLPLPSRRRDGN